MQNGSYDIIKYSSSAKRGVDFRSDWALSWGRRGNRMLVTKALSQDVMLLAFVPLPASLAKLAPGSFANRMLVTKALSQDVMLLAFVPLSLIPEESPILHYNQPLLIVCTFWHVFRESVVLT